MKKQLTKELPRVEKALKEVLKNWEDDHERFFIMHDTRYLDTIEQQWKEKEANKSQEKVKRVSVDLHCPGLSPYSYMAEMVRN